MLLLLRLPFIDLLQNYAIRGFYLSDASWPSVVVRNGSFFVVDVHR